jgi:hydroxylaminobenzene mutase
MDPRDAKRRLIWNGMFLILLGLLNGLLVGLTGRSFANPRMGLSAHVGGVMSGMLLALFGAVWGELRLGFRAAATLFWVLLYSSYVSWGALLLAAVFGTSRLTPIQGAAHAAAAWQEGLVSFGLVSGSLATIVSCVLALWGVRRRLPTSEG